MARRTRFSQYQNVKQFWILQQQEMMAMTTGSVNHSDYHCWHTLNIQLFIAGYPLCCPSNSVRTVITVL